MSNALTRLATSLIALTVAATGAVGIGSAKPVGTRALSYAEEALAPGEAFDSLAEGEQALPSELRRQIVSDTSGEAPGTIVIDPGRTRLFLVLGGGRALQYGIGVGREGFEWSGTQQISRKAEWPDWIPPQQMISRQPYLPRWVGGGPGNPLGARALYLGGTDYRIHGTNDPSSIGKHVSSGCIRMLNEDVMDLYDRVPTGTKVVVLPETRSAAHSRPAAIERVSVQVPLPSARSVRGTAPLRASGLY